MQQHPHHARGAESYHPSNRYSEKQRSELLSTSVDGVAANGAESGSESAAAAEAAEAALGDAECLITQSERGNIKL